MLKPSFYNHMTRTGGGAVLFNKFWGSIALVDPLTADLLAADRVAALPDERVRELEDGGFLVPADTDEKAHAEALYLERKGSNTLLGLTIELTQECNLACPFCYQNSYRGTGAITDVGIDRIVRYAEAVITEGRRPITALSLRFIGGEPLMQKPKIYEAAERMSEMCARHGVELHTQADTNGLLLDAKVIEVMDALSITITNKSDHDKARPRHNGSGSYDQIMKRLRRHANDFNEQGTVLAVRYNVNAFNAKYVGEVYQMVKGLGIDFTQFDIFNTVNYDYNVLTPTLTDPQFSALYLDVMRMKVEAGEIVRDFPKPTFAPCSAYTPFNLKVTADGGLALCDSMHTPRGSTDDLQDDIGRLGEIFADIAGHNPFKNPQCGNCSNVGICGGMLFCKPDPCNFLPFDMDDFLRFFAEVYPLYPDRFDLDRDTGGHLAFGNGRHHCLGAPLARLEARLALAELAATVADYEIDEAAAKRVHTSINRGFVSLPTRVTARR